MKRSENYGKRLNVNIRQINVMSVPIFKKDDEVVFFERPLIVV